MLLTSVPICFMDNDKKIYVLIVHGIGRPLPGYAAPLMQGLREKFNFFLQTQLKSKADFSNELDMREVIWDGVLAENQAKLAGLLKKGFNDNQAHGFRSVLTKVFSFVTRPLLKLRTDFAAEAIGDIIGYKNSEAYPRIQQCFVDVIDRILPLSINPADKQHLTVIAHSLGTVISSDFIYDRQKKFGQVHENFAFCNLFTLGSPLALFALQYGIELFKSPIRLEDSSGQWINIFDLDDPVAYPLKNLNKAYNQAVSADQEVNTGGFGISHTRYFENSNVQELIAKKLAQDWLILNEKVKG